MEVEVGIIAAPMCASVYLGRFGLDRLPCVFRVRGQNYVGTSTALGFSVQLFDGLSGCDLDGCSRLRVSYWIQCVKSSSNGSSVGHMVYPIRWVVEPFCYD